ncbi:hypothetical protein AMELA_G00248550 [Ameiurus melas]|uniref:Uncharacterized protein n=1 Tax=Ameiurus melas TaxID=219545 RepID=A0A7J5ZW56_AMEME|nr:hypothetical protein AMELA_G00248550 [Ameiurus melas]
MDLTQTRVCGRNSRLRSQEMKFSMGSGPKPPTSRNGSRGTWSLSQEASGKRRGTPWTGCQSITGHNHIHTHPFIHYGQFTNLPINLPCMSLDWGRKPEYPEETCKLHTRPRWESNPGPWRCEAHVLTTRQCDIHEDMFCHGWCGRTQVACIEPQHLNTVGINLDCRL